jgi:hypothetical protein
MHEGFMFFLAFFGIPAALIFLLVWVKSRERVRNNRYHLQANLYAKAVEKGEPIPPLPADFFAEPAKSHTALRTSIVCMTTGIAIVLTFWLIGHYIGQTDWPNSQDTSLGFKLGGLTGIIPFLIGVAYLIIHVIERQKRSGEKA